MRLEGLKPVIVDGDVRFHLPGVHIGTAEYEEGPTGCTVFHFPERGLCEVDVRGGSPGLAGGYPHIDGLFFGGGSLYGLEVGAGVAHEILAKRGSGAWDSIACVSGAIIYDYGSRQTIVHPDKQLGAAAFRAAAPGGFANGRHGAGRSATVGKLLGSKRFLAEPGGQGCAVGRVGDATIGVFTVVNALGGVVAEDGAPMRGFFDSETGQRRTLDFIFDHHPEEIAGLAPSGGQNTTVTAVVIDRKLPREELRQFGRQIHSSMAAVIQPFHTIFDGDILFAISVGEQPLSLSPVAAAHGASRLARQAVFNAVLP
jgi:6-aminohexanoate-oligomer endohydrolase